MVLKCPSYKFRRGLRPRCASGTSLCLWARHPWRAVPPQPSPQEALFSKTNRLPSARFATGRAAPPPACRAPLRQPTPGDYILDVPPLKEGFMFEGPRLKIKRANQHISDLNEMINTFVESDFY